MGLIEVLSVEPKVRRPKSKRSRIKRRREDKTVGTFDSSWFLETSKAVIDEEAIRPIKNPSKREGFADSKDGLAEICFSMASFMARKAGACNLIVCIRCSDTRQLSMLNMETSIRHQLPLIVHAVFSGVLSLI